MKIVGSCHIEFFLMRSGYTEAIVCRYPVLVVQDLPKNLGPDRVEMWIGDFDQTFKPTLFSKKFNVAVVDG